MTVMTLPLDAYREALDTLAGRGNAPDWIAALRAAGWKRFEELGFPALSHEDWRFTDVSPIAKTEFTLPPAGETASADLPTRSDFDELDGPRLVFVDGRYHEELSSIGSLPDGVVVDSLGNALRSHRSIVEEHLTALLDDEAFTALNTAFVEDGLFVHVPKGVVLAGTVQARYVTTASRGPRMCHPRSLVIVEESAHATVLEEYVSEDGATAAAFTNAVTQYLVGANANARHYLVEQENEETYVISTLYVRQERDSDFASHSALLGGALVRNNIFPSLHGEGCMSVVNGMYVPRHRQLHDNRMRVRHAAAHCESRQYYRGILSDHAKAMFSGRIIVDEGAQQTDAVQSNKNLLISPNALVETKPQLEIYADDVKCTHGATIGQLDEEALFYFEARGIAPDVARRLLTFAFVNEIFERMDLEPVRARLQAVVTDRLLEMTGAK
jgi:Fe-S cluster assembly protein SufD